jgi:hypothetical protein
MTHCLQLILHNGTGKMFFGAEGLFSSVLGLTFKPFLPIWQLS